ncbi:uncharacterized protein PG986_010589 [Apiospora aurea]|uniref:Carrier domain-containing protein n=1 Tax=Apiospora aurea TaxID=335848 RepID=A0ABR1Q3X0_9PEZI
MGLDVFQNVTRPKVDGSIHLDNLFRNDPLEFFVFFSSLAADIGSPGQSAYVAANAFMISLAEQRRSRGLAASAINIGPIIGAGYITQNQITSMSAKSLGMVHMSESDFHQLFAEAVVAGRPGSDSPVEIITGTRLVRTDEKEGHASTGKAPKESLQALLYKATSQNVVHKLVKDAVLGKLETLLELDAGAMDDAALVSTRLDELGLDSLMATEIRAWLLQLDVNYPVLKILSGISVYKLVEDTVESIPSSLIPQVKGLQNPFIAVERELVSSQPHSKRQESEMTPDTATFNSLSDDTTISISTPYSSLSEAESQALLASLNIAGSWRVTGPLDPARLQRAIEVVSQRHESLRTCIQTTGGNVVQSTMEASTSQLISSDVIGETPKNAGIVRALTGVQKHHFDLENGETLRLALLCFSPTDHCLIIGTSHLVMDGLSIHTFLTDLLETYNEVETSPTIFQYSEYVLGQRRSLGSEEFQKMFQFWQAHYPDFPPPLPVLNVSSVKARASLATYNDDKAEVLVSPNIKTQIQAVCRRCRVTPFHFYLACYRALLLRYTVEDDVVIGVADSNRTAAQVNSIGVYNNVLPLWSHNDVYSKFEDILRKTRSIAYEGLEHSLPFQTLLERQAQRKKLVFGDLTVEPYAGVVSKTGYDLALDINDDPEGDCLVALIARTDLYQKPETEILVKSYEKLLKAFATDPSAPINLPSVYDHAASMMSLGFGQGKLRESQWPETVVHRIDDISRSFPDRAAVEERLGMVTTYGELMHLSSSIARSLIASGAAIGSKVATLQEPTARWVASLLAIMRIGAIYIPLDLSLPWARLVTITNECEPGFLLLDKTSKLEFHRLQRPEMVPIDVSDLDPSSQPAPPNAATAGGQAMILFTSGSSGTPKGIALRHEGLRNWIEPAEEL